MATRGGRRPTADLSPRGTGEGGLSPRKNAGSPRDVVVELDDRAVQPQPSARGGAGVDDGAAGAPVPSVRSQTQLPSDARSPRTMEEDEFESQLPRAIIINVVKWNDGPTPHTCQFCNHDIQTHARPRVGTLTYVAMAGICLLGGFLGCCLIPLCAPRLQDVEHRCPHCTRVVGIMQRWRRND